MKVIDFLKNANLLTVLAWIVVWNILCGIGIYYDGFGPIDTVHGAVSMIAACLFALSTSLFGLLSERGKSAITASYGDFAKIRPMLQLFAFVSGILTVAGAVSAFGMIASQA